MGKTAPFFSLTGANRAFNTFEGINWIYLAIIDHDRYRALDVIKFQIDEKCLRFVNKNAHEMKLKSTGNND